MYRFTVQPVVIILILFPAVVKTAEGNVEFWRESVTLTCPKTGQWYSKEGMLITDGQKDEHTLSYEGRTTYYCQYETEKYYFYVEGKVCRNCFELDSSLLLGVLVVNLAMTIVVMIIVYKCTKKKMSAGFRKAPARSAAPPTPSRDYEELKHTRSQDPYSFVNRTG